MTRKFDLDSDSDSDSDEPEVVQPIYKRRRFVGQVDVALTEKFDMHKLNYLVENRDTFEGILRASGRSSDQDYDPFKIPSKYLLRSRGGEISVRYRLTSLNGTMGRLFADGSLSMQSMTREIRHTIAADFYDDVDMVNAHPVILQHFCRDLDIECKALDTYIEDRDVVIKEIVDLNEKARTPANRDSVKSCILSLINGGRRQYDDVEAPSAWLVGFKSEISRIKTKLEESYPHHYNKVKRSRTEEEWKESGKDYRDSALNVLFCEEENKILMHLAEFLHAEGCFKNMAVLCFDGIMVPKLADHSVLAGAMAYVSSKVGFEIQLKAKPMDQGFDLPAVVAPYDEVRGISEDDEFTWRMFEDKYSGRVYQNVEDIVLRTAVDLRRVLARIVQDTSYYVKKTDCGEHLHDIVPLGKSFSDMYFKYHKKTGRGTSIGRLNCTQYLKEALLYTNRYNSIDFRPDRLGDPTIFNLFTGYEAKLLPEWDKKKIKRIARHVRDVICAGDQSIFEYYMQWVAHMLEHPGLKTDVVPFLYSSGHGAGKNMWLDFLRDIIGEKYFREVSGITPLLEKHNTVLRARKLIVVNEASSTREAFMSDFQKLKSLVTDSFIYIDPKGKDGYNIRNCVNVTITSNNNDSLRIEAGDRRFLCLDVSCHQVGNTDYFKKLYKSITAPGAIDHFMTYAIREFGGRVKLGIPPMTTLKADMIKTSESNPLCFLCDMVADFKDGCASDEDSDEDSSGVPSYLITAAGLFDAYKRWCEASGERAYTRRSFQRAIKTKIEKASVRRQAGGSRVRYYDIRKMEL